MKNLQWGNSLEKLSQNWSLCDPIRYSESTKTLTVARILPVSIIKMPSLANYLSNPTPPPRCRLYGIDVAGPMLGGIRLSLTLRGFGWSILHRISCGLVSRGGQKYKTNDERAARSRRTIRNSMGPRADYTQGDSDVISFHIYASWFSPPSCG